MSLSIFFFFNDTATTEIYTLSLHDALPILAWTLVAASGAAHARVVEIFPSNADISCNEEFENVANTLKPGDEKIDRKSTRLNSSHQIISYAVFCLKKKKKTSKIL